MKRALVLLVFVFAIASAVLGLASSRTASANDASAPGDERFTAYDVWIDSGAAPLAAWQVEIAATDGRARLVGVEGGDPGAFAAPPYYDPKALASGERIVLAAFDTGSALPSGRARVARIHVLVEGPVEPRLSARIVAAADSEGRALEARVEVRP